MRAMTGAALAVSLLMGCDPSIPQRPQRSIFGVDPLEQEPSDADKNAHVRRLVGSVRARFGSNAILGIRAGGPQGHRFKEHVRVFGERGAIAYRENGANFELRFSVLETRAALTGPGIRTYEVTTSLVRLQGINEGAEILSTSTKRGSCNDNRAGDVSCSDIQGALATRAIYSLPITGGTSAPT
jgi:hypothetical protein